MGISYYIQLVIAGVSNGAMYAVIAVGYDDATKRFTVRNSWGETWGKKGYCFMPYAYLTTPDLADDFWTIRTVEVPAERAA